jgi:nitrogen fixation NifU-like protein
MPAMPPFSGFGREPLDYDGGMAVGYTPVDDDLYREIILDHYRNPRHHHAVVPADRVIEANNPLCGDEIDLSYRLDDGTVAAIGFTGRGCSISQASASMLCEAVTGMSVEDAASLAERFRTMLTGNGAPVDGGDDVGDLEALRGVRAYPVRVKCATLVWNALLEGLSATADTPAILTRIER